MGVKVVNLEAGRPPCEAAMQRLSQELRQAKAGRVAAIKVIHGYGSSGQGGAIRTSARRMFTQRRLQGQIRAFCPGEEFTDRHNAGQNLVRLLPQLRSDRDFGRQNDGITIVLL